MNETELLFTQALECDRAELYLNKGKSLNSGQAAFVSAALKRRIKGEPIQYILGKVEFMGLEFKVNKDVLIPRPETEILVETAIKIVRKFASSQVRKLRILDIGTGSGCIAISLAKFLPNANVTATDISEEALGIARDNAILNGVGEKVKFIQSDLYLRGQKLRSLLPLSGEILASTARTAPFRARMEHGRSSISFKKPWAKARGASFRTYYLSPITYHLIISNPPYIATSEIDNLQPELKYEPRIALDGGKDGLGFYRRIIKEAPDYLSDFGILIMEMGFNQRKDLEGIFRKLKCFNIINIVKDYNNIDRVIVAKKDIP